MFKSIIEVVTAIEGATIRSIKAGGIRRISLVFR